MTWGPYLCVYPFLPTLLARSGYDGYFFPLIVYGLFCGGLHVYANRGSTVTCTFLFFLF